MQLLWKNLDAEHDFKRKLGITREEFMNSIFHSIRDKNPVEAQT
jgi:hypothetical protein